MVRTGSLSYVPVFTFLGALLCSGCPNQELAQLVPCTVSAAYIDAAQSGINKVDVLFVIDNSGSMSQEQVKLSKQLPRLVNVLITGDLDGMPNADGQPDFTPVQSLHLGIVSSDLGVNGQPGVRSCGDRSFLPTEQDAGHTTQFLVKPHGDEGRLLHSADVAVAGVSIQDQDRSPVRAIEPRLECAGVQAERFLTVEQGSTNLTEVTRQFGCIAELGVNGCGFEQQLESMWRALAPSSDHGFSGGSAGQGAPAGANTGFLRDDAVLVVILVSDEEDCSSPDASGSLLYDASSRDVNVLCARHPDALHPASRYIAGLKSLKPMAYQDRIIFAGIIGVPTADVTAGRTFDQILGLPEMQVKEEGMPPLLRPACVAANGDGRADPARRMVEVAKGFGENGVVTSICEADYGPALGAVIKKIADKLTGACLPRQLKVNAEGRVDCDVVEIKAANDHKSCADTPGRDPKPLESRNVGGSDRIVCKVQQLPVIQRAIPSGNGWYYDNFTDELLRTCRTDRQRIAFSKSSPLSDGALARVECQQSVLNGAKDAKGREAINTSCADDGSAGLRGDDKCRALSIEPAEPLLCVQGTCQLSCATDASCPPGFTCTADALGRLFCANPTCPISDE